jgi:hypothetical protein
MRAVLKMHKKKERQTSEHSTGLPVDMRRWQPPILGTRHAKNGQHGRSLPLLEVAKLRCDMSTPVFKFGSG